MCPCSRCSRTVSTVVQFKSFPIQSSARDHPGRPYSERILATNGPVINARTTRSHSPKMSPCRSQLTDRINGRVEHCPYGCSDTRRQRRFYLLDFAPIENRRNRPLRGVAYRLNRASRPRRNATRPSLASLRILPLMIFLSVLLKLGC